MRIKTIKNLNVHLLNYCVTFNCESCQETQSNFSCFNQEKSIQSPKAASAAQELEITVVISSLDIVQFEGWMTADGLMHVLKRLQDESTWLKENRCWWGKEGEKKQQNGTKQEDKVKSKRDSSIWCYLNFLFSAALMTLSFSHSASNLLSPSVLLS